VTGSKPAKDYDARTIGAANPLARFAHRSRLRRAVRYVAAAAPTDGVVLDFGAGTAAFLRALMAERPDIKCIAVEPYQTVTAADGVEVVGTLASVRSWSVDVISALEVCEHLPDQQLLQFIDEVRRVLRPGGRLVVSVPVVMGPVVLLKEFNRVIIAGYKPEYSATELIRCVFGLPVERPKWRRRTHKGFDYRQLERLLRGSFGTVARSMSPLAGLPAILNSQVFFVCAERR
jgi:SAM-dependent methyltransferase